MFIEIYHIGTGLTRQVPVEHYFVTSSSFQSNQDTSAHVNAQSESSFFNTVFYPLC